MPLTNANNTLQATITSTDINGNTSINRGLGNPTLNGNQGNLNINFSVAAGTTTLGTGTNFFNLYMKNDSAPGSGITVTPIITPSGGAAQTLAPLQPGGVLIIWNVVNNVPASGYTTLAVTVAGGTAQIELFTGN